MNVDVICGTTLFLPTGSEAKGSDDPMDANQGVVRAVTEVRTTLWWLSKKFQIKEGEHAGSLEEEGCCPSGTHI